MVFVVNENAFLKVYYCLLYGKASVPDYHVKLITTAKGWKAFPIVCLYYRTNPKNSDRQIGA